MQKQLRLKHLKLVHPVTNVNELIGKLNSPDFEQQADTMEEIADMVQNSPQKATELLDTKVIDSLLGIMNKDDSNLEGPSEQQTKIREQIMSGKHVSDAETAIANKITPKEQAEKNKMYAIYTTAFLDKLYGSEIEKMTKNVVQLSELPGVLGVVQQIKNNPNPMVRVAGIDSLSYNQRPEYKEDLTAVFTIAQKDQNPMVQKAANKALAKLANADATKTAAPAAQKAN